MSKNGRNEKIIQAIFSAVDEFNEQSPEGHWLIKSTDTIILDGSGKLDSLGLITLIMATEQKVEEEFGVSVILADEKALSQKNSPFKTIGTLADYISLLLEENANA